MNDNNLHKEHRIRVKKKFRNFGLSSFEDHEKLELLLYYVIPRKDTNPIAHDLLNEFKTLGAVFAASIDELTKINGIGIEAATLIKIIPELSKELVIQRYEDICLDDYAKSRDYFSTLFFGEKTEKVKIAFLDDRLYIMKCIDLFEGSPGSVSITARKIAEAAFKNNCEQIIIAHNHPNGISTPSSADIRTTRELYKLLSSIGIILLDHIITGGGSTVSMKEIGALTLI